MCILSVRTFVLVLLMLVFSTPAWSQAPATLPVSTAAASTADALLIDEAKRFMDGYAVDLRHGDVAAIVARYDRNGVHEARPSKARFTTRAQLSKRYQDEWSKPGLFEWRDLSYEVLAPDTVLVTGLFAWGESADSSPGLYSYVGILQRQDGELRIRLEAEASRDDGPSLKMLAGAAVMLILVTLLVSWRVRTFFERRRKSRP